MINYDSKYCTILAKAFGERAYKEYESAGDALPYAFMFLKGRNIYYPDCSINSGNELCDYIIHKFVPEIYNYRDKEAFSDEEKLYMSVIVNDVNFINGFLNSVPEILCELLDELIRLAIDMEKYEIQVMLTDFKHEHNLFTEKKWKL